MQPWGMSLDPHFRLKGEEDENPGLVARNTEWFCSSEGVGVWTQTLLECRYPYRRHGEEKILEETHVKD